jgi:hypothetical protein
LQDVSDRIAHIPGGEKGKGKEGREGEGEWRKDRGKEKEEPLALNSASCDNCNTPVTSAIIELCVHDHHQVSADL